MRENGYLYAPHHEHGKWVGITIEFDGPTDIDGFERYISPYIIVERISQDGKEIAVVKAWAEGEYFAITLIEDQTVHFRVAVTGRWYMEPTVEELLTAIDNFEFFTFDQRATVLELEAERAR